VQQAALQLLPQAGDHHTVLIGADERGG